LGYFIYFLNRQTGHFPPCALLKKKIITSPPLPRRFLKSFWGKSIKKSDKKTCLLIFNYSFFPADYQKLCIPALL